MGSDPAPFMVNVFLYYYEDKCISKEKKTRSIADHLTATNEGREFGKALYEIYPPPHE